MTAIRGNKAYRLLVGDSEKPAHNIDPREHTTERGTLLFKPSELPRLAKGDDYRIPLVRRLFL
jgi:hypothetical protein